MIIPVGTSLSHKRLPWMTIALIVINAAVFGLTNARVRSQEYQLYRAAQELWEIEIGIEARHAPEDIGEPEGLPSQGEQPERKAFWERFQRGEVVPASSGEYRRWETAHDSFFEALDDHVFQRLGFHRSNASPLTLLSSMFVHAGWLHLLGNMLFLWTVGVNMEEVWGKRFFLFLYLFGGSAAGLAQLLMDGESDIPCIGASGAVAAAMGAFLVRHFRVKIRFFVLLGIVGIFSAPAGLVLPLWFGFQLLGAFGSEPGQGGVAFWAHIGGFALGAGLGLLLRFGGVEEKSIKPQLELADRRRDKAEWLARADHENMRGDAKAEMEALELAVKADPNDLALRRRKLEMHRGAGDRANTAREGGAILKRQWLSGDRTGYLETFRALEATDDARALPPGAIYRAAVVLAEDRPEEATMLLWQLSQSHADDPVAPRGLALYADLLDRLQQPEKAAQVRGLLTRRYPEAARALRLEAPEHRG